MERKLKLLPKYKKQASLASAASLCILLSGCYGMYEGKADKNLKTAKQWQADVIKESKDIYERADAALKAARQASSSGQGGEAKTQAKEAAQLSEQAMDAAKVQFATQQLKAAEEALQVATKNNGQSENQSLFNEAEAALNESREKSNDQKYEDSIEASNEAISAVDRLLARLKGTAENRVSELDIKLKELETAKGEQYTPQALDRGREAVTNIRGKVENDRDYRQAILLADAGKSEIETAIIESKKKNSEDDLRRLEDKIAEAIAEEAPIHVPDALKNVQDRFENILASFYEKQYDTVLSGADNLRPRVDELITMARIEATKDRIAKAEEGIQRLNSQNVEQYLPGALQTMQELVSKATDEFNNNNYEGAKFEANNALVEMDRVLASFDAFAAQKIQLASTTVASARQSYDRMKQVFGPSATPIDSRLESRYQVQATELSARLEAAAQSLASAQTNRESKEYQTAVQQSESATATASGVANGTYGLVAENAVLGIQDQISVLERQGAREYAPAELSGVQKLVRDTQRLLAQKQNREAAQMAARTRATLENVKQGLARQATVEQGEVDRVIQRIEGGAGPTPAAGGRGPVVVPQRQASYGEVPGGASEDDRSAMLGEVFESAAVLPADKPVILAQTHVGNPINSSGWTGEAGAAIDNRSIPGGTFMTTNQPSNVYLGTGQPTGAAIGTRTEPVVSTYESNGSSVARSERAYEGPTAPGPFAAVESLDAVDPDIATEEVSPAGNVAAIKAQIDEILNDNQRAKDLEDFKPDAIEAARQKLDESSSALAAQDYLRAVELARDAQRIIVQADRDSAKKASERDLQAAADRINLANAAGAAMFAPAELMEARRLYDQGNSFLKNGDYHEARKMASRAMIASEDARTYNVTKARDLTALSVRYGGHKASHPAITESNRLSDVADDLMRNPATAPQGQEVAKQAVALGQVALDAARDFTYQERLDNIYKALNTALRAGANYFNVTEVKRLIAELAVAREEYCTRNFDAVELKLKDIEARLARIIETTPLVLEENLIETTEKLNALVLAGAENWMAQEVDDVKSLMNRAVIDFRKHDYQSSYVNIKNAMQLTDRIEGRLQEQVYFDAITEIFAQLDKTFHSFSAVLGYDRTFLKKLVQAQHGQPKALDIRGRMNPNEFRDAINDIYARTIHLKPPKSQEGIHREILVAVKSAKVAAENFQKLFILDQVSMPDAYDIIDTAYNQINRSKTLRGEIQVRMIEPQARMKVIRAEKIINY